MAGSSSVVAGLIPKWDTKAITEALVSKASKGSGANGWSSISGEVLEVLEAGVGGKASAKDVASCLKQLGDQIEALKVQERLADLLWLVGEEAVESTADDAADRKAAFKGLVQQLLAAEVVHEVQLRERLSEEGLQEAGLVRSAADLKTKLQRLRTGKVYSQQKYNLLREENEGFSKLIVELEQGGGDTDSKRLSDIVQALIAYFSLDPNRALDVILDCFEARMSDAGPETRLIGVLTMFDRTSLVQVLGFKLKYYHTSRSKTPASLLRMCARLMRCGLVKKEELYVHVGGSDEEEGKSMDQHMKATLSAVKEFRIFNLSKLEEGADKQEAPFCARPHASTGDDNQRLALLAAVLEDGNWEVSKWLLEALAPVLPAAHIQVAKALCSLARASIAPLYASLPPSFRPTGLVGTPPEEAASSLPAQLRVTSFDQLDSALLPILAHLSIYVYHDPVLVVRLCRIIKAANAGKPVPSRGAPDWMVAIGESLIGALALLPQNCAIASEVWEAMSSLHYLDRYMVYANVQWNAYNAHPELLLVRGQVRDEMRKLLKASTKDNVTKTKRSLARLSHSNPLVVIEVVIDQVQEYQSMVEVCRDALAYSSSLTLDIFSYMAIEELGGALLLEKPMLLDDYANLARWLINFSDFVSGVYVKYPHTEVRGMLVHILTRLQADSFGELEVLRQLINKMAGLEEHGGAVSQETLMAKAGGEVLRASIESPWPLEQVFGSGDDKDGKSGGAAKVKAYQSMLKERKEAADSLVTALDKSGTGMALLVVLGQQVSGCMHTKATQDTMQVKFTSWLHRQCHQTLQLLQEFLSRRIPEPGGHFLAKMPDLPTLVGKAEEGGLAIDPEVALLIMRPAIRYRMDAGGKNLLSELDLSQHAKAMLPNMQHMWKLMSPEMYAIFWSLSLDDIFVPKDTYLSSIKRLKKALADLEDPSKLNMKDKEVKRLRDNLTADVNKLEAELKRQEEGVKLVRKKLEADKESWLANVHGDNVYAKGTPGAFYQLCILPRCVQSAEDAIFCAKFVNLLHAIKTPKLCTIIFYNQVLCNFGPIVFSRTEHESSHLGRFLSEVLEVLNDYSRSESVYKKHCDGFPGFRQSLKGVTLPFAKFQRLVRHWQSRLAATFSTGLNVSEGVEVHNSLTILSQLVGSGVFPIFDVQHEQIKAKIQPLTVDSNHTHGRSITVMAKSIHGRLEQCEDKMQKLKPKAGAVKTETKVEAKVDDKKRPEKSESKVSDKGGGEDVAMKDRESREDRKRGRENEDERSGEKGRHVRSKTEEASAETAAKGSKGIKEEKTREGKDDKDRDANKDDSKKERGEGREGRDKGKEDKKDTKEKERAGGASAGAKEREREREKGSERRKEERKGDEREGKKDERDRESTSKVEGRLGAVPSKDSREAKTDRNGAGEKADRGSKDAPHARGSAPKEAVRGSGRDEEKRDSKRVRREEGSGGALAPPPAPDAGSRRESGGGSGRAGNREEDTERRQGRGGAAQQAPNNRGDAVRSREQRFGGGDRR